MMNRTIRKVIPYYMNGMTGGFNPIENINCPSVKQIANHAVAEYNKRSGANLKLEKVISGDRQVVAGTNYSLILATSDGSSSQIHRAAVFEPLPCTKKPAELLSFDRANI